MNPTVLSKTCQQFEGKKYYMTESRYYSALVGYNKREYLHRAVWTKHHGPIPEKHHVHHRNHDTSDNRLENLVCVHRSDHARNHMTPERRKLAAKNVVKYAVPAAKAWHATQAGRAWHSEHGKKTWRRRKLYEKHCAICKRVFKTPFPQRTKYCHLNCKMAGFRQRHPGYEKKFRKGRSSTSR